MYRLPSTSTTWGPSARATKYGVPPTERKARTREFTPAEMTSPARLNNWSLVSAIECLGHLTGQIGEDHVGAGPSDRGQMLQRHGGPVDPAPLGRRLQHRVLAADVIGRDRHVD